MQNPRLTFKGETRVFAFSRITDRQNSISRGMIDPTRKLQELLMGRLQDSMLRLVKPFTHRDYALLASALMISTFAAGMWAVAMVYQVRRLGGGPLELSMVATSNAVGLLALAARRHHGRQIFLPENSYLGAATVGAHHECGSPTGTHGCHHPVASHAHQLPRRCRISILLPGIFRAAASHLAPEGSSGRQRT